MGGSAVKLADPSENDEYAPKHEEPFYMALVIECKDFPQAPGLNSMDKDKIDKPVTCNLLNGTLFFRLRLRAPQQCK